MTSDSADPPKGESELTASNGHSAHLRPGAGLEQPALRLLSELQRRENVWVLLCNFDRWCDDVAHRFADALPLARTVMRNAPSRVIWGTDWPHPMYRRPDRPRQPTPDDAELLNFLGDMTERDAGLLTSILADNPLKLYRS